MPFLSELFAGIIHTRNSDCRWKNFDVKQLKKMDFLVEWKDEADCLRRIKVLILIVHIIRTFSIFMFIMDKTCKYFKLFKRLNKQIVNKKIVNLSKKIKIFKNQKMLLEKPFLKSIYLFLMI
jgi:hypothetical protein